LSPAASNGTEDARRDPGAAFQARLPSRRRPARSRPKAKKKHNQVILSTRPPAPTRSQRTRAFTSTGCALSTGNSCRALPLLFRSVSCTAFPVTLPTPRPPPREEVAAGCLAAGWGTLTKIIWRSRGPPPAAPVGRCVSLLSRMRPAAPILGARRRAGPADALLSLPPLFGRLALPSSPWTPRSYTGPTLPLPFSHYLTRQLARTQSLRLYQG